MVVERPSTNNGGKLLILGVEFQTWIFIVVNIVALAGFYFSLRNDVDTLINHEKQLPTWAVQMTAKIESVQEAQGEMKQQLAAVNDGGGAAIGVLREQVNSLAQQYRESNSRQDHMIDQIDSRTRDTESVLRYIIQYFGAHPSPKGLKKSIDKNPE